MLPMRNSRLRTWPTGLVTGDGMARRMPDPSHAGQNALAAGSLFGGRPVHASGADNSRAKTCMYAHAVGTEKRPAWSGLVTPRFFAG